MRTPQVPVFSSSELRNAVEEVRPHLEGAEEVRNRISSDIKQLEVYLRELEFKTPFTFALGKYFVPEGEGQYVASALENCGTAEGLIHEDALSWSPDASGRFRLVYTLSKWEGMLDVDTAGGPLFWNERTLEVDSRPLIETKFEVRKKMYEHLASFVRALGAELAPSKAPGPFEAEPDEIPF